MNQLVAFVWLACLGCGNSSGSMSDSEAQTEQAETYSANDTATFAGGCFWCIEAVFERVKGVAEVVSGYSGGVELNPTYEQVGSGRTGHTESVQVYFDSSIVSFNTLLDVFFHLHDPTQADGQHPDYGRQYRSAIFYHDPIQLTAINTLMDAYGAENEFGKPIVTEVSAFTFFQVAEEYHQNYYRRNPNDAYVRQWTVPKVQKFKKLYPELYFEPAVLGN